MSGHVMVTSHIPAACQETMKGRLLLDEPHRFNQNEVLPAPAFECLDHGNTGHSHGHKVR